jgi:hypothetical protein
MVPGGSTPFYQTWTDALTKPSEQTYAALAASPHAKATTAYLWVFIATLVEFLVISLVQSPAIREALRQQGVGDSLPGGGIGAILITAVCGGPIGAIVSTLFFAIGAAIVQWVAKLFGGQGTFDQMAYALGAIGAPYGLVAAVFSALAAIPYVGFCFRIVLSLAGLYVIVLNVMAVKGVNKFGWGQAAGSVLIPWAAVLLSCCCAVFAASAIMGPALGNIFSSINQSLAP